ncbi:GumC family protein [Granulicella cerasi]|uniref:non-specific protein-tyrosine kinase n=1 Tax=Granulicella cerasi TaxID=741063 RepID=A0ABW1ZA28_9BACT|nr:polysaccharide biosynthesis tyrosine autokinase [Granulicella cerasi]
MIQDPFESHAAGSATPPPNASHAPQTAKESGLLDALTTLRKRKWIILAFCLGGILLGLVRYHRQPRLYEAVGSLEIGGGSSSALRQASAAGRGAGFGGSDLSSSTQTQIAILQSHTLLLSVARDLDLANNPDFWGAKGTMPHRSVDDPLVQAQVVAMLNGTLNISALQKTDIITVTSRTGSAKLSADIVNRLMTDYIHRNMQTRFDATKRASSFLSGQLDDLKQKVEDSQAKVIELGKRIGVLGFDPTKNQITSNLDTLTKAVGEAEVHRILSGSRYSILRNMDPGALDASIDASRLTGASALSALRAQREGELVKLAELSQQYGPKHPEVEAIQREVNELNKQINVEQNRLLTQAREEFAAARAEEGGTRSALEDEKADAYRLRDDLLQYTLLQRDFESSRTLYDSLQNQLRSAGITAGLEATEIDIVDYATPPVMPSMQPRSTIMMVNFVVATLLGLIIAFIVDALDTGIHTVSELEQISGLPSLALIPRARRIAEGATLTVAQRNLALLNAPRSQFAESFRALRTSLLLSTPGSEPQVILVTSSIPNEGKTTAAMNLACVLAQRDMRVLLIDADLRRPSIHHRLGLNGKKGLTSILSGSADLESVIQNLPEIPTLDVLVSGPVPPFPQEMLGSEDMRQLLLEARQKYTHIIIDSPPLLSVTDSQILAREVDTVVLMVRYGKSTRQSVRRGREMLQRAGARVAGIALNAVDTNSPEYYSYYGYSGYTTYGSGGLEQKSWDARSDASKDNGSTKGSSR